jgi:S1-C subfamily serine protease
MTATPAPALAALSDDLARLSAAAQPSLVRILDGRGEPSGFVWRAGLVVTSDEALADDGPVHLHIDGATVPAEVAGRDPTTDVALLRAKTGAAPAARLTEAVPALGSLLVAAGQGVAGLALVARSEGPWRSMRGGAIDARIDLDLTLRHGLPGGLALLPDGSAAGMVVAGPRRSALVIPTATVARVAALLAETGRVARGYLGLGLQPVAVQGEDRRGVIVVSVDAGGPAAAAGVFQGDVVVALAGEPLRSARQLARALGPDSVGRTLALDLRRGGDARQVTVTVGERPEA